MEQQLEEQGDDDDFEGMDLDQENSTLDYPEEVDFSFGDPYLNTMSLAGTEDDIASGGFGGCSPSYTDILSEFEDYSFVPFSAPPEVIFRGLKAKVEEPKELHEWEKLKYTLEELYEFSEPLPHYSRAEPTMMDYDLAAASGKRAPVLNIDHVIFHMPAPKEPRKPYPKYSKYPPGYKSMRKDVRAEPYKVPSRHQKKRFEQVVPYNYKVTINPKKVDDDQHLFLKPPPKLWQPALSQAVPSIPIMTTVETETSTTDYPQLKIVERLQCCLVCFEIQWPENELESSPSEKLTRKILLKENANYLMGRTDVVPKHLNKFLNGIGSSQNFELGICTNCLPMMKRAFRNQDSVNTIIGVMNIIATSSEDVPDDIDSSLSLSDFYNSVCAAAAASALSNFLAATNTSKIANDRFEQLRQESNKKTRSTPSCTVTSETVNSTQVEDSSSVSVSVVDMCKSTFQAPSTHQPCMIIPGLLNAGSTPGEFGSSFSKHPLFGTAPKTEPCETSMFVSLNACKYYSERKKGFQSMESQSHSSGLSPLGNVRSRAYNEGTLPINFHNAATPGVIQQVQPGLPSPNQGSVADGVGRPAEKRARAPRKSPKRTKDREECQPIGTSPPPDDKFKCKEKFCGKIAPMSINTFIAHAAFHYYRPMTCVLCENHFHSYKHRTHWKRDHRDTVAFPRFERIKFDPEVNWKCGYGLCQKVFKTSSSRDHHECSDHSVMRDGFILKKHFCSTCANGTGFKTGTEWKLHRIVEHPDVAARSCPSCSVSFGLITKEGAEIVDLCAMLAHSEICSEKIPIACEFCGIPLMSLEELQQHLIIAHEADPDRSFMCFICGEKFTFEELRIHMISCHEATPFHRNL